MTWNMDLHKDKELWTRTRQNISIFKYAEKSDGQIFMCNECMVIDKGK